MKRTLKFEIDVKFAAVTLFLAALVIFMVYLFSSSAVFAEDTGYVGEYIDEFSPETTAPASTTSSPVSRAAAVQMPTMATVEAAKVGTASDPLITLSYLQNVAIPQLEASLLSKLTSGTVTQQTNTASEQAAGGSYTVIELTRGQSVTSKTDSIEIIVRPGTTASAISPFKDQGLADLTGGAEILNGENLPINHILLVPRSDGRGILITSSKAYIMVRGDYEIR